MTTWRLAQINQILHWAEDGQLDAQQVARLAALAPLQPQRDAWLAAGVRVCGFAGALLLVAALVFFFAYNWDDLHHFAKLGIAAAALGTCVAVALGSRVAGRGWQVALFAAMACTGALLALIGQIYQTGADLWELFAAWSVLMLPFALLARAWPSWLLCLAVGNLAMSRLLTQEVQLWQWGLESDVLKPALWSAFNLVWWLAARGAGRAMQTQPSRHLERSAGALVLVGVSWGAVVGVIGLGRAHDSEFAVYIPLFLAAAAGCFELYRRRQIDIAMLGVLSVCLVVVAASVPARLLFSFRDWYTALLLMAVVIATTSSMATVWLRNLIRHQNRQPLVPELTPDRIPDTTANANANPEPSSETIVEPRA